MATSLFLFNCQIETPPADFIKLVEQIQKDFLWSGTPKIAHNTIIADYKSGGINYKDLNSFIAAVNVKFIQKLLVSPIQGHLALPNMWIKKLFNIPINPADEPYFWDFFTKKLNILNCLVRIPRKANYNGHPFYYSALKTYEHISEEGCLKMENLISIPIWFNRIIKTKFDCQISQAGFNFLKDLFPENIQVNNFNGLGNGKIRKLRNIINKIPQIWKEKIVSSEYRFITVITDQVINIDSQEVYIKNIKPKQIYNQLIQYKIKTPTGILQWLQEFDLSGSDIKTGFLFARECSKSTFDHVFQYKIMTQILPTNQYLSRYRVVDSDLCSKCDAVSDTIKHCLWQCQLVVPFVDKILNFLNQQCQIQEIISIEKYLFGFSKNAALNQILLELKN